MVGWNLGDRNSKVLPSLSLTANWRQRIFDSLCKHVLIPDPRPLTLSLRSLSFRLVRSSALQVPLILIHRDRCAKETRGGEDGRGGGGEKRVLLNTNATG